MDTFRSIARGLILALLFVVSLPAAATVYPTRAAANFTCMGAGQANATYSGHTYVRFCVDVNPGAVAGNYQSGYTQDGANTANGQGYCPPPSVTANCGVLFAYDTRLPQPPSNPCTVNAPSMTGNFAGSYQNSFTWCKPNVPVGDGTTATVSCAMKFTATSPPTSNQWGSWHTQGSMQASGDTCDGTGAGVKDTNGNAADPQPPSPNSAPPVTPAPKACGGGSCYDPANDKYCATSGSTQYCVSGSAARSASGGCASSGDSTMCAGSPNAPAPSSGKVPDPATAVRNTDTYTQKDPTTGANQNVSVTTYTPQGGTPSSSGKGTGDSGPAPASTAPGADNGSYAGGANCDSPPACSGDTVMCGVALQTWRSGCMGKAGSDQLHKDLTGDGAPPDGDHVDSSSVWQAQASTGDSVADAANQGNYDQTGMGFSTACPMVDMTVSLPGGRSISVGFSKLCKYGDWIAAIVVAFALFAAAKITGGGVS